MVSNGPSDETQDTAPLAKCSATSPNLQHQDASPSTSMRCDLPPHTPETFTDSTTFEAHYLTQHMHRCLECHRNCPSAHFLDLHIEETHDPIVAARRARGEKTYRCFVEGCDKICSDWKKRRSHLVDKHLFPRNYDFFVVKDGIDGRKSLLRPDIDEHGNRKQMPARDVEGQDSSMMQATLTAKPRRSTLQREAVSGASSDDPMDEISDQLSSLQLLPRSITFGRRKGRAGFAKS